MERARSALEHDGRELPVRRARPAPPPGRRQHHPGLRVRRAQPGPGKARHDGEGERGHRARPRRGVHAHQGQRHPPSAGGRPRLDPRADRSGRRGPDVLHLRPFGTTTSTGQSNANPSKFTGREDDGTGLYYYRARYYHPGLHRFIREDPLRFLGGESNFYAYVGTSPLNAADPLGLLVTSLSPNDPHS
ncbi:MAG TPA: RHS repeat-associated core domain-containing protein [Methylomirabilota bacterium]|nr:RHS repeat-associated core domain-containing protein [Methylomirabilota bacterium]